MGKSFWDTIDEPCIAFSCSWGEDEKKESVDKEEMKLLKQEIAELKQLVNMKKVKAIEADCKLIE